MLQVRSVEESSNKEQNQRKKLNLKKVHQKLQKKN
jgi:hypothetical protein